MRLPWGQRVARTVEERTDLYTLTCFDESDAELRDIRVFAELQWKDLQTLLNEISSYTPVCIVEL